MIAWICSFSGLILVLVLTMPYLIDGLKNRSKPLSPESLLGAAQWGLDTQVQKLLAQGKSVHEPDDAGNTPLHYALQQGHVDVVKQLLDAGADAQRRNRHGKTPLELLESAYTKKRIDQARYSACKGLMTEHVRA